MEIIESFHKRTEQQHCAAVIRRWAHISAGCAGAWTKPKAVIAAARKLARLIYTMLTKGEEYTDQGQYYEERYRERVLRQLVQRAEKMRMKLVDNEQTA